MPALVDPRIGYVLSLAESFFSLKLNNDDKENLLENRSVVDFLDNLDTMLLSCLKKDHSFVCSNQIIQTSDVENVLILFKVKNEPIKVENLHQNIFVTSMVRSPLRSMYYYIQRIYTPYLSQRTEDMLEDPKLERMLRDLEGRLRAVLLKGQTESGAVANPLTSTVQDVLTFLDEANYWKQRNDKSGKIFFELLEPLAVKFMNMNENHDFTKLEDLLDETFNVLDDVWKQEGVSFPDARMENLMDIVGNELVAVIQRKLRNFDFWRDDLKITDEPLRNAIGLCSKWIFYAKDLTTLYWPNHDAHRWTRKPFQPHYLEGFLQRLKKVHSILSSYYKFKILFNEEERKQISLNAFFTPFKALNTLHYSEYTEPHWRDAIASYESRMAVIDREAAIKLKKIYQDVGQNTLQLLQVLSSFGEILSRPLIQNMLLAEREALLEQLHYLVSTVGGRVESEPVGSLDVPQSVANLIRARQDEEKISFILSGKDILSDLNGYNDFVKLVETTKRELKDYHNQQFAEWTTETSTMLRHKGVGLRPDDVVIYFEEGKLMSVNFSKRLVSLIRETRQLKALGYPVPTEILEAAQLAQACVPYAKTLNKIATFHNTIGDQIIRSQKSMMLKNARALSKLVQSQNAVTWKNLKSVEEYIESLQKVVKTLAKDNHKLSQYHYNIIKKISQLMDYDMYKNSTTWHNQFRSIRQVIEEVEKEFTNTQNWRNHIDWQVYKIVECQYRNSLQDAASMVEELSVELYISDKAIKSRPSLAQLKKEFLNKLKTKFLIFPKSLPYFGDENIYTTLIEHNSSNMGRGFQIGSLIFEKLKLFIKSLYEWASIATIDIIQFIDQNIRTPQDWEQNLKASKFLAQEFSKFSRSPIKVECFSVSMVQFWDGLENENTKCWKTLISSLRLKILMKISELESFVKEEMLVINEQPNSVEEYVEVHFRHSKMLNEQSMAVKLLAQVNDLHDVLKTWTGEVMPQTVDINSIWSNYQSALINFNTVFIKKAQVIQEKLNETETKLKKDVERFSEKWTELKPSKEYLVSEADETLMDNTFAVVESLKNEWKAIKTQIAQLSMDCEKMNLVEPTFDNLKVLDKEINQCEEYWSLMQQFRNDLMEFANQEWILVRRNVNTLIENFLTSWQEKIKDKEQSAITIKIKQGLSQVENIRPYLKYLQGESFTEKHWHEVFNLFNKPYKQIHTIVLGDLLFSVDEVEKKLNELKEINNRASAEVVIRQAIAELDIWEIEAKFQTAIHYDSKGGSIVIIKDFKSVMNKIGDNQSLVQSIGGAAGTAQFLDRISLWEKKLDDVDQHLKHLSQVQQKWVYLEPILNKSSIEQSKFGRVSKEFRQIMSQISHFDFKVISLQKISNVGSILENSLTLLDQCQRSLLNYLEEKRLKFPRFYFMSDGDLLEMLGQPNREDVLQANLKKVFPGVHSVVFSQGQGIVAVLSSLGEKLVLRRPISLNDSIEVWLEKLSSEIKSSLKLILLESLDDIDPSRTPSQILCLVEQINFTKRCEEAIANKNLKKFYETIVNKYTNYTKQIAMLRQEKDQSNKNLVITKVEALLIDCIEHLHRVKRLMDANVTSTKDWNWEKCTRFYIDDKREVVMRIADAEFSYSYEYLGNQPKLIHTSLTDKCFLTLTQALFMGLGGNPYGPAGTGKTESVKSLGAALGRQVLVFNCDEGLDFESLTRIMVGIVKCGAFGCFDEFNRLEENTLSLISLQIKEIQEALKMKVPVITLLNKKVEVDFNSGIFVTLNPAGKGYGGRQKLPESLKSLFRPVAMGRPDDVDIASALLHTQGFLQAEEIARKLVTVFETARNILPDRGHYDWGLRALKTVVNGCGHFLKDKIVESDELLDPQTELKLVTDAVQMNTLCKLSYEDGERFRRLLADLFPGVDLTVTGNPQLEQLVQEAFGQLHLVPNQRQSQKCLELYELLKQRMGVVIVGPPKSGKSTIIRLLEKVLVMQGLAVRHDKLNPKSISRNELLGFIDLDTRQWNDGVLTSIAQKVYHENEETKCWIHCDGDVDPEWIEALNSVLDDNRLLTLPSGWRLHFGPGVNFLFETHHLCHASPATISRMGIVFLSEEDLKIEFIIEAWLQKMNDEMSDSTLEKLHSALSWIREKGLFSVECPVLSTLSNCLSLIKNSESKTAVTVALINGLGFNLTKDSRRAFNSYVGELMGERLVGDDSEVYYDEEADLMGTYEQAGEVTMGSTDLVPNPYLRTALDLLTAWFARGEPVLIVGPSSSGKRLLVQECIRNMYNTELITIECNPQLQTSHVLDLFHQNCSLVVSNSRKVYRPRNCDKLIIHFSHINLLYMDKWGSRMVLEFLKQATSDEGFYDSNMDWVSLQNVNFVYTVTTIEEISMRFISSNHILYIREPDTSEMNLVYSSYLKRHYPHMSAHYDLAKLMVSIFLEIQKTFGGPSGKITFSTKDLTKWVKNLSRYEMDSKEQLSEAFLNEANRLFKDKLFFSHELMDFGKIIKSNLNMGNGIINYKNLDGFLYICEKNDVGSSQLSKVDTQQWKAQIEKDLLDYEGEDEDGQPILTEDILKLMCQLEAVLTEPGGSVLLGGRVGVGRKTALKAVAKRRQCPLYLPKTGAVYSEKSFRNDLKNVMQMAGVNGDKCYFLLEDYQIDDGPFILNILSCVLSSGEVPGLYSAEEFNNLIASLKTIASDNSFEGSVVQFFNKRVHENFHLIISFDIDNKNFIRLVRENPILSHTCYEIRMNTFSKEAMTLIPTAALTRGSKSGEPSEEEKEVIQALGEVHRQVEDTKPVAPISFFTLIRTYANLNKTKKEVLVKRLSQLEAGISKMRDAQKVVEELKEEAREQEVLLQEKQGKSNQVLKEISATMSSASLKQSQMEELRRRTEEENLTLQSRKEEIDKELAEIEPVLQEARAAVGNIKPESITEIRSLRAPTSVIRDILEGVLRLMGIQDTSWNSMKTFLSQRGVRDEIRFFDASQIRREDRDAVAALLEKRRDSFLPSNAKRASLAAAPLAAWVTANVQYSLVLQNINPLTTEQAKLERNIKESESKISELGSGLEEVGEAVARLQEQLKETTREGAEIELNLKQARERSRAAQELVHRLAGEYTVWLKEHSEISETLSDLWKSCVLASAFVTYLSNVPEKHSSSILDRWKEFLNVKKGFSLSTFLSSDNEFIKWTQDGLPSDNFSWQNGIIALNSRTGPLLVDPLSVGRSWLFNTFKSRGESVEVISHHSSTFLNSLELSLRFGKTVLVEISDRIPCVLMPVLQRNFIYPSGTRKMLYVGEKLVDYNERFRMFLLARDSLPEVFSDRLIPCPVLSFRSTRTGLSEQLLDCALRVEKPELERQRLAYIREEEENKIKLYQMQEDVLQALAHAQGDILLNQELLKSLEVTKERSVEVERTLENSKKLRESLNRERDLYRSLADYGTEVYFACLSFSALNPLYHVSVDKFKQLFQKSLTYGQVSDSMGVKCKSMLNTVYDYVSRSLLKSDIVTFALFLTRSICPEEFQENEWEVLTGKLPPVEASESGLFSEDAIPAWVEADRVSHIHYLQESLPSLFHKLDLKQNKGWLDFMSSSSPQPPKGVNLTPFQKVLLVQALRPDHLYTSIVQFILQALGIKYIYPPTLKLNKLFAETAPGEPILIITSPGNDPSRDISALAASQSISALNEVAAGPGCESKVLKLLSESSQSGGWVIVKNLQLMSYWLPVLEKELHSLQPHDGFRLWLVTEPSRNVTPSFLSLCLKITYESPPGIKRNMERIYDNWLGEKRYVGSEEASRAVFALAWLHGILQERRTYIPQGWTSFYEFNDSDLNYGRAALDRLFSKAFKNDINLDYLKGLFETVAYGGRINNAYDLRVLSTYLNSIFKKELIENTNFQIAANIRVPRSTDIKDHLNTIKNLPETNSPEILGLPKNVNGLWERETCISIIEQLKALEKNSYQDEPTSFEEEYALLTPIINHWKKMYKGKQLEKPVQVSGDTNPSPIATFFDIELAFSKSLLSKINLSLEWLEKSLRDGKFVDEATFHLADQMKSQQVPEVWENLWSGPSNTVQYLQSVLSKSESISSLHQSWMEENNVFDLAHIFNVDHFFAALKQQAARFSKASMENLVLAAEMGSSVASIVAGSVIVTGLLVEGASITYNRLTETHAESSTISVVPNVVIKWTPREEVRLEEEGTVRIPLYLTDRREKVVVELPIPSEPQDREKWLLGGTAFYIRS